MKLLSVLLLSLIFSVSAYEVTKTEITDKAITWTDSYGSFVYIPGLEKDLFQEYEMVPMDAPKWEYEAEDAADDDTDFHEATSYWAEEGIDDHYCGDQDLDDYDVYEKLYDNSYGEYEFDWKAIVPLEGGEPVMFAMQWIVVTHFPDVTCRKLYGEYIFLNDTEEGVPTFLGEREYEYPYFD